MTNMSNPAASGTTRTGARVIIVGAGPVGLLTALRLGRAGIKTLVLESHHVLLPTTRAMVYMPVVLPVLKGLDIFDKVTAAAFLNKGGVVWRDLNGKQLAQLPLGDETADDFGGVLLIGQWRMNELVLEELKQCPTVEVRFGMRVVGIDDQPGSQYVRVMTHSGSLLDDDVFFDAEYVVATDGANSSIRRMLCVPFEGFTFQDFKMIGTDVIYDFMGQEDYAPLNFVVHDQDWAVIAFTGQDEGQRPVGSGKPQWRIAYVEHPSLSTTPESYMTRAQEQVKKYIHKGDGNFRVIRAEPYLMQQRVAAVARKGRVLLAGDALHSNNPIGGLGLTGGILDAFCYGNALVRVLKHGSPDTLLTTCADARRTAWIEVTNKLSQDNMQRLYMFDVETAKKREALFQKLNDPTSRLAVAGAIRKGLDGMMKEDFRG